jgi:alkylation response protein AidB-like acyl-CoA dehydrogenase
VKVVTIDETFEPCRKAVVKTSTTDHLGQKNSTKEMGTMTISVEDFADEAARWLKENADPRPVGSAKSDVIWGEGEFSVSVFHALSFEDEKTLLEGIKAWQQKKASMGYHAITGKVAYGGLGLTKEHARAYSRLEAGFQTPDRHETFSVTTGLIAPTIEHFGTDQQKQQFIGKFLRTDELCCQLFSEPGAGSDLASLACRAVRDGDEWVINGQKVWSSGAQFSEWGELIARSDADVPKHKGMTAFIIPMDLPGIEIRPIGQMSGGSSFNEVFFNDVRVPDSMRLGDVGDGWNVALTTLSFERDHSDSGGSKDRPGGNWAKLLATAKAYKRTDDPAVRDALAKAYIRTRIEGFVNRRAADLRASGAPAGPEGSLGKLIWTEGMTKMAEDISLILGPRLIADTGEWGSYEWREHVLGAPGYRIAGGSDEVQRNIIGERVLGLPPEPRVDKNLSWKDTPR